MEQADFDRVLGLMRDQGKHHLVSLVLLLTRNGFDRADISAIFVYLGQGLGEERIGDGIDWLHAVKLGAIERKRGAFEEFYGGPARKRITK